MKTRALVAIAGLMLGGASPEPPAARYPAVRSGVPIRFPADHGAHPAFRTEWWYVTGWLDVPGRAPMGFQITFFRTRPGTAQNNPSRFAPRQILFAHAALSDPAQRRLVHDQRIARAGFGLADASTRDTNVRIGDWRMRRGRDGIFRADIPARDFTLNLAFRPTQPPILQGQAGYSRKGPQPAQASHYYSVPQLEVTGSVSRGGQRMPVTGRAWLDREWSSTLLDARAVGWDWLGINLDDGGALMAFRVRDAKGASHWAGGSLRQADGRTIRFGPGDVVMTPIRRWRSPHTGASYPVEQMLAVRTPGGWRRFRIVPLMDDQELDSRAGGGPVYWEGAVRTAGGRGYLELTGYASALRM
ncbi:MAG: carotenoid 1,2-hydratase [Sphingomonas bacterium]|nr:carotenoid 1,2-hydratase [Sphingomonas bacterium]